MPSFKVSFNETIYKQTIVEADSEDEAKDIVWNGQYDEAWEVDSSGIEIEDVKQIEEEQRWVKSFRKSTSMQVE